VALQGVSHWQLMGLEGPPAVRGEEEPADGELSPEERMALMGMPPWMQQQGMQPTAQPTAPPEPQKPTVEVFRGTQREVVQVD
jgi:hypothetical protein